MALPLSICSFSFHRMLGEGKQDIFQYVTDCKSLGCTHLQPWNAHFTRECDIEQVKSQLNQVAGEVKRIRSGIASFTSGAVGSVGPILGMLAKAIKRN